MPRTASPPRMHIDAVPRVSLFDVRANVEAGRPVILWRDAAGAIIGQAKASITGDRLRLDWAFRGKEELNNVIGQDVFGLVPASARTLTGDHYTRCPRCMQVVSKLAFYDRCWTCSTCHGLFPRSELISHVARQSERLIVLDGLVGNGRPKSMQARTYERLRHERKYLEIEVGDQRITPRAAYAGAISARWLSPPPRIEKAGKLHAMEVASENVPGSLLLTGDALFSREVLLEHLRARLQRQAHGLYHRLGATRRRVSGLQVRRAMTAIDLPVEASITPEPVVRIVGRLDDGRLHAEHRSAITGDHDLLAMTVEGDMPNQMPRATVKAGAMTIGVVFEEADTSFVPALVQAQIEDFQAVLSLQRAVLERFDKRQADHVREAVRACMQASLPTVAA